MNSQDLQELHGLATEYWVMLAGREGWPPQWEREDVKRAGEFVIQVKEELLDPYR